MKALSRYLSRDTRTAGILVIAIGSAILVAVDSFLYGRVISGAFLFTGLLFLFNGMNVREAQKLLAAYLSVQAKHAVGDRKYD